MDFTEVLLITTVPTDSTTAVLTAMGNAGAGEIGLYTHCAFTSEGIGRFKPDVRSNPAVGEHDVINTVAEVRIDDLQARTGQSNVGVTARGASV